MKIYYDQFTSNNSLLDHLQLITCTSTLLFIFQNFPTIIRAQDLNLTLNPPPPPPRIPPSPPPIPSGSPSSSSPAGLIVGITIVVIVIILVICCCWYARRFFCCCFSRRWCCCCCFSRKKKKSGIMGDIESPESLQFEFSIIKTATKKFSDANILGQGGFGQVFKGKLLDGQEIAVKRLSKNSGQGLQEFKNEVLLLHKLQHRNLVRLLGFCLEGEEKLLVYEYLPNRSLDYHLFDPIERAELDWEKRYKIIGGIARGLLYLHEDSRLRIIHRDLKAANVLLDGEMNAKIADFGMAKLFGGNQTQGNTSKIGGTFGYIAPEYASHGLFSVKSDVFSFGVLVLEIISGQRITSFNRSNSQQNLLSYAWKQWQEEKALALMDTSLSDNFSENEVMKSIHIGLLCVQQSVEYRPTMSAVVSMLNSNSVNKPSISPPAFFEEHDDYSNMVIIDDSDLYEKRYQEFNQSTASTSKSEYMQVE